MSELLHSRGRLKTAAMFCEYMMSKTARGGLRANCRKTIRLVGNLPTSSLKFSILGDFGRDDGNGKLDLTRVIKGDSIYNSTNNTRGRCLMNRQEILDQHIQWQRERAVENPEVKKQVEEVIEKITELKRHGELTPRRQQKEIETQRALTAIAAKISNNRDNNLRIAKIAEDLMTPIW